MRWILRSLVFLLVLIGGVIGFAPKKNLYFQLEEILTTQKIIISDETLEATPAYLDISGSTVYFNGIDAGLIQNVRVMPLFFYNEITLKNARFNEEIRQFVPARIDSMKIDYGVHHPLYVRVYADGDFGTLNGFANLKDREIILELDPSQVMLTQYKSLLKNFKKQDDKYVFSRTF